MGRDTELSEDTSARQRLLLERLSRVLPKGALLTQTEELVPYECDGLTAYRETPMAVALPETEEQLRRVLQACSELGIPIVPRGAGTSLSGGAMPHRHGLTLGMSKFNKILEIDPVARIARVQPGVRNLAVSEAAAAHGLYYAPDPSSQIACTIGGNIAENSGGVHCLKYGLTLHNVRQVRAFLSDGEEVVIGSRALDAPGLDLLPLVVGSEGLLLIVVEATLMLRPTPPAAQVVLAAFDDVQKCADAVAAVIGAGIIPAGLEMMDHKAIQAVEPFANAGYPLDAAALLLCESDGSPAEVEEEIALIERVLWNSGATSLRLSKSEAERRLLWSGRKNAFPAVGRISPDYMCLDGSIPRKQLAPMLLSISQMEERYGLRCANVFHAGDGNLHPLILFDASDRDQLERAEAFGGEIMAECVRLGGTITGEHGVGVEKLSQMCLQFSPEELAAFRAIKRAYDPAGVLNPEKAIPTLHRCSEFGRMRVHLGATKFPELPRF